MLDHSHQKSQYQFIGNFHLYLHVKGHLHLQSQLTSFLKHCKGIESLLFWVIWACLATHTSNDSINLKKYLMFFCKQNINFILPVFKDIANVLFWVLWASLVIHIQNDTTTSQKTFVFIWRQNKKCSGNIAKICKLRILGTFGMPGQTHII